MKHNEFDNKITYKLYREVKELLKPIISKKNISDYIVVVEDSVLPIRIFYPKRVSDLNKVMVYVRGNGKVTGCNSMYSEICQSLAEKTDRLVVAIEYVEKKKNYSEMYNDVYETVKFLYKELEKCGIDSKNLSLAGDSTGANIVTAINYLNKGEINILKEVLFYPVLSLEYFGNSSYQSIDKNKNFNLGLIDELKKYLLYISYKKDLNDKMLNPLCVKDISIPNTLVVVGSVDCLLDEAKRYCENIEDSKLLEIPFANHGFLKRIDEEIEKDFYKELNNFLD